MSNRVKPAKARDCSVYPRERTSGVGRSELDVLRRATVGVNSYRQELCLTDIGLKDIKETTIIIVELCHRIPGFFGLVTTRRVPVKRAIERNEIPYPCCVPYPKRFYAEVTVTVFKTSQLCAVVRRF